MANDPRGPRKGPKIQLQMDEAVAEGTYANLVLINHTENEFVLDFAFLQPTAPRAKVHTRIISSPRHTARLLRALEHNLRRFEARFGPIDIGDIGDAGDAGETKARIVRMDAGAAAPPSDEPRGDDVTDPGDDSSGEPSIH